MAPNIQPTPAVTAIASAPQNATRTTPLPIGAPPALAPTAPSKIRNRSAATATPMMTLPDLNGPIKAIRGKLFPFGWAKLLWWLRKPTDASMRVPLMGVLKRLQSSRLASQLAFMMIEYIRRVALAKYGTRRSEIGWVLDDNQGMNAIADAIGSKVNREYFIYDKAL